MKQASRIGLRLLTIGLMAGLTGFAWAGAKSKWPLTINLANGTATGSMATVRASKSATEQLGCAVRAMAINAGDTIVSCWAVDAAGVNVACSAMNNSVMVSAVAAINPDSIISFAWDKKGTCVDIEIMNVSWAEPKVP